MEQPIMSGPMTKKFLMGLPEGVYLVSGVGEAPGQPAFAEIVAPLAERGAQSQRILSARFNNRSCEVFRRPADYIRFSLEIKYRRELN
jgi:hypothetical protein